LKLISSTSFSNGVVALYYEQLKNRISISRDSFWWLFNRLLQSHRLNGYCPSVKL